jgi:hypothetical protein
MAQFRSQWIDGLKKRRPKGSFARDGAAGGSSISSAANHLASSHISSAEDPSIGSTMGMLVGDGNTPYVIAKSTSSGLAQVPPGAATHDQPSGLVDTRRGAANGRSASRSLLPLYITQIPESIAAEDLQYLHANGALTIPTGPLRDHLIRAFVEYVYPFLPLLDLEDFLRTVLVDGDGRRGRVSLLVFQAVMLAGSGFVDLSALHAAGFQSRRSARRALLRKVKVRRSFSLAIVAYWRPL